MFILSEIRSVWFLVVDFYFYKDNFDCNKMIFLWIVFEFIVCCLNNVIILGDVVYMCG